MKTHTIEIDGVKYTLRMTGTIGIQVLAQSFVPNESERTTKATDSDGNVQDVPTGKWMMALLYAVFYSCNEKAAEEIDFLHFMMSFSTKEFNEAMDWYFKAYAEREGLLPAEEETDKKPEEGKNS